MNRMTLEQAQKEEKKRSWKENVPMFFFLVIGLGSAFGIFMGLEYLQVETFSTDNSLVTTPNISFLDFFMVILIGVFLIPTFLEFIFINSFKRTVKQYLKIFLPIAIFTIGVLFLSFYSYTDITEKTITYDPFWFGEKQVYAWGDIEWVVIDEASDRSKDFDYYLYFKDDTTLDIWGSTRMYIDELKLVDDRIREMGIPKEVNVPPNEMEIKEGYGREDKEIYQMIEQVIRD